jgi:hypothetical protein
MLSYITDEIDRNWCELLKYKNNIISSNNRLGDIKIDSCFYKIRYMDGFSAKPILEINTNENNAIKLLLYNENSITSDIYDSLNIYFVNDDKNVAIFRFSNYNYNEKTYFTNYDLYASSDYCGNLPVLARIESEYDICEDKGVEYNINWGNYITKLDSLRILLNNSNIE